MKPQHYTTNSVAETHDLAERIFKELQRAAAGKALLIFLHGEFGVGKTELTKGLAAAAGVEEVVTSPSYTYLNEYDFAAAGGKQQFIHVDLWRMDNERNFSLLDLANYLKPGNVVVVEWAGKLQQQLDFDPATAQLFELEIKETAETAREVIVHK